MSWEAVRRGRCWYVQDAGGEFLAGAPCNYGPRGRITAFRSEAAAQRRADSLNAAQLAEETNP